MASSPLNQSSNHHARSNSLPSRPHPLILQCNEHLCRLGASDTPSSSSTSSLSSKLSCLQDLHECVEKLLQLSLTQQAIVQEELLDGSLRLLDMCSAAKDALIHTKECIRELQSIIRRRPAGDMGLEREARKYLMSRKVVKNAAQKALKGVERKRAVKNHETPAMVTALKEAEAASINVFESLLSYIAGPKVRSKSSNWSLVSKLVINPKRVACENEETDGSEVEKVDAALYSIIGQRRSKSDYTMQIENVHNLLAKLEPIVQDLEEGLECLFRRLIKTRVCLLNIFNN
jgi:exonuclease VII small subunit